jgi:hypothetical protein
MEKKFDAVKMVRDIRDKHYEEMKGKSHKEIMECYRKKAASFLIVKEPQAPYHIKK